MLSEAQSVTFPTGLGMKGKGFTKMETVSKAKQVFINDLT
jgi:hypothetical protein